MKHKYLFILCPPSSGSTLLWQLLRTSPHVGFFRAEGQTLVKDILFTAQRWDPALPVAWEKVRAAWESAWDMSKPVLLEKSPPHLVRARQLQEHFPGSHFVVMVRNPYAYCEGIRRRWRNDLNYATIARRWVERAVFQCDNRAGLQRVLFFTYEELCADAESICRRLVGFVPELERLQPQREFAVFEKNLPMKDLNARQIARLSASDIREINAVLGGHRQLLAEFGYEMIGETDA